MLNFKLNNKDITYLVSNLTFESSIDSLSTSCSFTVPQYKNTNFFVKVDIGDKVEVSEIFKGIVVDISYNEEILTVKAFDIAFYLNKNKVLKQIRNTSGSQAIKSICSELGIPVVIKGLDTKIVKLYKNQSLSDVINDIISQDFEVTGKKYYIFAKNDKIFIDYLGSTKITPSLKLNDKLILRDDDLIKSKTSGKNIEDLKNAILITVNDTKGDKVEAESEDNTSINKYGRLQEVIEIDAAKYKEAKSIAKQVLKSKNKMVEKLNISFLTNDYILAGQKITVNKKDYYISNVNIRVDNSLFDTVLELIEL